jgi:hypothetical protein
VRRRRLSSDTTAAPIGQHGGDHRARRRVPRDVSVRGQRQHPGRDRALGVPMRTRLVNFASLLCAIVVVGTIGCATPAHAGLNCTFRRIEHTHRDLQLDDRLYGRAQRRQRRRDRSDAAQDVESQRADHLRALPRQRALPGLGKHDRHQHRVWNRLGSRAELHRVRSRARRNDAVARHLLGHDRRHAHVLSGAAFARLGEFQTE